MTTYRLFPSTDGPSSAVSYSGAFASGIQFGVTSGGMWFTGYWWWVCPSGQSTAPQTFALYQVYQEGTATIIADATVTSGALTPGQWNYVPIETPLMLSVGGGANLVASDAGGAAVYLACTGFSGSFPITDSQFGAGDPFAAGIANGPLSAFSDQSGSLAPPWNNAQGVFSTNNNITSIPPFGGSDSANFWMDVQVSDTGPENYSGSYRIWPNLPYVPGAFSNDEGQQTTGTEFWLSESCTVDNIWFWSPPGAGTLPTRCAIFDVSTQAEVTGTDITSPTWSGAAGAGWVSYSYTAANIVLPAGKYKVCIYTPGGAVFYQEDIHYFGTGPGANGITAGPLSVPNNSDAAGCISGSGPTEGQSLTGNSTYQDGPWAYPDTFDTNDEGENRYIDIEVTPVGGGSGGGSGSGSGSTVVNPRAFLVFFP